MNEYIVWLACRLNSEYLMTVFLLAAKGQSFMKTSRLHIIVIELSGHLY